MSSQESLQSLDPCLESLRKGELPPTQPQIAHCKTFPHLNHLSGSSGSFTGYDFNLFVLNIINNRLYLIDLYSSWRKVKKS